MVVARAEGSTIKSSVDTCLSVYSPTDCREESSRAGPGPFHFSSLGGATARIRGRIRVAGVRFGPRRPQPGSETDPSHRTIRSSPRRKRPCQETRVSLTPPRSAPPSQLTIGFVWFGGIGGRALSQLTIGFVWSRGIGGRQVVTDYHWVRLVSGPRGSPGRPSLPLGSFGLGASEVASRPRLPLGSFGFGASEVASRYRLPLGSFGLGASRVASRYSLPLGSFGLGASGIAGRLSLPLGSFGSGHRGSQVDPAYHWVRLVRDLGGRQSLQLTIGFVWSRGIGGCQSLQLTIGFVWSRGIGAVAIAAYHWVRLVSGHRRLPVVTVYHWVRLARGEGDLLESSRRIDKERGREGEPSSTNTIEEGAEPFQVFLRQ